MNLTLAAIIFIFFLLVVAWFRIAIRGGSIRKQWWSLVLAVFLGWNLLIPLAIRSATYQGKVVDEETGQPLQGAVVTVIWYTSPFIYMDRTTNFLSADETITQGDGSFYLWTWPAFSLNPFTTVETPPEVIIYKAGYVPLSTTTAYARGYSYEKLSNDLKKGTVMKLPKLQTREEASKFASPGERGIVPYFRIPNLVKEVNLHRRNIGLTSDLY